MGDDSRASTRWRPPQAGPSPSGCVAAANALLRGSCHAARRSLQDARARRSLAHRAFCLKSALVETSSKLRGAHEADRREFKEASAPRRASPKRKRDEGASGSCGAGIAAGEQDARARALEEPSARRCEVLSYRCVGAAALPHAVGVAAAGARARAGVGAVGAARGARGARRARRAAGGLHAAPPRRRGGAGQVRGADACQRCCMRMCGCMCLRARRHVCACVWLGFVGGKLRAGLAMWFEPRCSGTPEHMLCVLELHLSLSTLRGGAALACTCMYLTAPCEGLHVSFKAAVPASPVLLRPCMCPLRRVRAEQQVQQGQLALQAQQQQAAQQHASPPKAHQAARRHSSII